jgi:DNA repair protein RadC
LNAFHWEVAGAVVSAPRHLPVGNYLGERDGDFLKGKIQMETTIVREVTINYRNKKTITETLKQPEEVAKVLREILPDNSREHFLALYLSGAHKVIGYSIVSTGLANSTLVHPREVFQAAILSGATALLIGHNHPSGEITPSREDRAITKRLKEVAELIGIKLLDHIIVTDNEFYSFNENFQM